MTKLTASEQKVIRYFVDQVRNHDLTQEFMVSWVAGGAMIMSVGGPGFVQLSEQPEEITRAMLTSLENAGMMTCSVSHSATNKGRIREGSRSCLLTQAAFDAVDSDFDSPDTSFVKYVSPLQDVSNLDEQLNLRCLPILSTGATDPVAWDSATRNAGVVLEERLRKMAGVGNSNMAGVDLVNYVFGKNGLLSHVMSDAELQSHRNLYAGVIGVFRNRSAHRLVDPTPDDGGAYIVFVNLLLKMTDDLSKRLES